MRKKSFKYVFVFSFALLFCFLTSLVTLAYKVDDWAAESVKNANLYGIIPLDMYNDDYTVNITRSEVAELAVNAYERINGNVIAGQFGFSDTYNNESINKVCTLGIMNGRDKETFSPYDYVTREEMAKIILLFKAAVNSSTVSLPDNATAPFYDFGMSSDWAKPYISLAKTSGVFSGYDDNTFRPKEKVSREMAIALFLRCAEFKVLPQPVITYPATECVVQSRTSFEIGVSSDGMFNVFLSGTGSNSGILSVGSGNGVQSVNLDGYYFPKKSVYYIFAECNGVYSEPVKIYTDSKNIPLTISKLSADTARISWERISGIDVYNLSVTEKRNSYYKDDIKPASAKEYSVRWEDYIDIKINMNRVYDIKLTAGDYSTSDSIYSSSTYPRYYNEVKATYPTTKAEAEALMTTVQVPVWKIKNGQKVSSTAWITVHHMIADEIRAVFEEIYNGPEKFPIKDVGGYSWRGGRSEHNGGTAIDINSNENYCIYNDGTIIGSYWKPYEDVYSITPYGDVVNAFEKYGFTWGGDSWRNPRDYMHFSYLGT